MEFVIEEHIDDAGCATYTAYRAEELDSNGIPSPHAVKAEGETPLHAIIALCYKLLEEEETIV